MLLYKILKSGNVHCDTKRWNKLLGLTLTPKPFYFSTYMVLCFSAPRCAHLTSQIEQTIWVLAINFITQMINNHLCCQSTNMLTTEIMAWRLGLQSNSSFSLIYIHHAWITTACCIAYGNTFTTFTIDIIVYLELLREDIHQMWICLSNSTLKAAGEALYTSKC